MASLASLVVSLVANTGSFNTNMDRTAKQHAARMRKMEKEVAQAGRAIGVAFAAAAGSLSVLVQQTTKNADEMQKLAQRTGLSTEALSQYKHVADLSGVSFEQFTNGIKRMQRSISDANVGLSTQTRAFERLGINVEELLRLSPDEQFERIAGAMAGLESATLRSATAQEIFGRSGTELLSVMSEGEAGIKAMREEADRLGLTIGSDFADDAALFNDNMERIAAGFKGAANQLTAALLPSLLDLQTYFMQSASASDFASNAGERLGAIFKTLAAAFVIVKNAALGFGKVLLGVFDLLLGIGQTTIAPITGAVKSLIDAFAALKSGDLAAAGAALAKVPASIGDEFEAAADRIKNAGGFIVDTLGNLDDGLDEVAKVFSTTADRSKQAAVVFKDTGEVIGTTAKKTDTLADSMKRLDYQFKQLDARSKEANKLMDEGVEIIDELIKEHEDYERALRSIVDAALPIDTAIRRTQEQMDILNRAMREGDIDAQTYAAAVRYLAAEMQGMVDAANNAEKGIDLFAEAVKEGIRILERTLSDLFNGLVDGSLDAFDVIESGFKALIASMAQQASRRIVVRVEQAFGEGGGGLGDLFNAEFGGELIASIGQIIGLSSADSLFGQLGSSLGSILGKTAGVKLLTVFGSFGGPIGSAIGAILGSVLGDLVGGLFERDLAFSLGGVNNRTRGDNQQIRTPLGDILGLSGQGGFGSLNDPSTFGGQLAKALTEFDTQIANILKTVGVSDETFDNITSALNNWVASFGEGADAVDVVASRFGVILSQFDADIQNFVRGAADFEQQIERFGVALSVEKLIGDNPEFFSGRTAAEVLSVVSAFQSGAETMSEAFEEFLQVANAVIAVTASLREFADSDLEAEFRALINPESLEQSLANVNAALLDSIANFDGSIDALNTIGQLALVAREGELKLLQQIDDIQKGLNSNLDKLRNDILGVGDQPQTITQTFLDAEQLIRQLGGATSSQEIASIGQEFDALIRGLDEDQIAKARPDLLKLIDLFQQSSNLRLDFLRQNTLDNAASVRDAVGVFLTGIGDPLNIIAESLSGDSIPEVMDEGLENINQSVQQIGPQVAAALGQVFGDGINVTVVVQDSGLVTQ